MRALSWILGYLIAVAWTGTWLVVLVLALPLPYPDGPRDLNVGLVVAAALAALAPAILIRVLRADRRSRLNAIATGAGAGGRIAICVVFVSTLLTQHPLFWAFSWSTMILMPVAGALVLIGGLLLGVLINDRRDGVEAQEESEMSTAQFP